MKHPADLAHREGPNGGSEQEFWQLSEEMEIKSIKDTFWWNSADSNTAVATSLFIRELNQKKPTEW